MSKHYETNSMYPYSSRAFQRYQEHDVCPNTMKPTQCTSTCQELSNDIKSMTYVQTLWNQLNVPLLVKSFPTISRAWRMSKHYQTNSMYLFSSRAFQRYQELDEKPYRFERSQSGKQNKQTTFLNRYHRTWARFNTNYIIFKNVNNFQKIYFTFNIYKNCWRKIKNLRKYLRINHLLKMECSKLIN